MGILIDEQAARRMALKEALLPIIADISHLFGSDTAYYDGFQLCVERRKVGCDVAFLVSIRDEEHVIINERVNLDMVQRPDQIKAQGAPGVVPAGQHPVDAEQYAARLNAIIDNARALLRSRFPEAVAFGDTADSIEARQRADNGYGSIFDISNPVDCHEAIGLDERVEISKQSSLTGRLRFQPDREFTSYDEALRAGVTYLTGAQIDHIRKCNKLQEIADYDRAAAIKNTAFLREMFNKPCKGDEK